MWKYFIDLIWLLCLLFLCILLLMPRAWSYAKPKTFLPPNPVFHDPGFGQGWETKEYLNMRAEEEYSLILGKRMDEPSLYQLSGDKAAHSYRFFWSRAFDGPMIFRLTINPDNTGSLVVKSLDRSRESMRLNQTRSITSDQVSEFYRRIQAMHFWERQSDFDGMQLDGSAWFLEGVRKGNYWLVVKLSPTDEVFTAPGMYLLELSGLKDERVY